MEYEAQDLIDSGNAWLLEGHVGRQCMHAIEAGACILGPEPRRDAYGNRVPAWWMVEPGTEGSPEYAEERGWSRPEGFDIDRRARELAALEA